MLLVFGAPCQLLLLAGPEHGRTIPLPDIAKLAVNIRLPPLPGIDRIPHLTNSSMMGVDFLPRHGPLLLLAVS